ncbi:unnamed protein product [Timema podura]|uniref:Uncharacterized protein n=1 Tax=Timema podura TaxID=61482 RepID=A0ABN7PF74_TIMPD|nr:unnamed protein product [Timema podura]
MMGRTRVRFPATFTDGGFTNITPQVQFDHGLAGNLKAYGTFEPPEYNLSRITAPVSLYCGESDLVVDCIDVERLHLELTNARMKSLQRIRRYTHLDFRVG